jgi:uncharacterized delta-60 repeat protein
MKNILSFCLTTFLVIVIRAQSGSIDSNFNISDAGLINQGFNGVINDMSIQNDGKIIVGGSFSNFNGTTTNFITRLDSNGELDTTFNIGTGANNLVQSTAIQNDGKILIGGLFSSLNGTAINGIARLNTEGTLDNTFTIGTGFSTDDLRVIAVQNDGKIIVGGDFTLFNGSIRNRIVRLNPGGSLDNTFNIGIGFNNTVHDIYIQNDGKIIVVGNFTSFNGTVRNRIIRLNSNGTNDTSFNPGTGATAEIRTIKPQNNGKIIIAGDFTSFNGVIKNKMTLLNTDGTADENFSIGNGFNNIVYGLIIQSDDKIVVTGNFNLFNGINANRIVRLNSDGSFDSTFNFGNGANDFILATLIQNDGKIIIGGAFTSFDGTLKNRIARINNDQSLNIRFFENEELILIPNPVSNILNINTNKKIDLVSVYNVQGQLVLESKVSSSINVESLTSGQYIIKIISENKTQIKKFIKF